MKQIIMQWNANRLDLFELSLPNEVGQELIKAKKNWLYYLLIVVPWESGLEKVIY